MAAQGGKPLSIEELGFRPIAEAVGVPDEVLGDSTFGTHLVFCAAGLLSDYEVKPRHKLFAGDNADQMRAVFGDRYYHDGSMARDLSDIVSGASGTQRESLRPSMERLIGISATAFAEWTIGGRIGLPPGPTVWVDRGKKLLHFDVRHKVALRADPQTVVDYGPGFQGRFHVGRQFDDASRQNPVYSYFGLARGPFIPAYLREYRGVFERGMPGDSQTLKNQQASFEVSDGGIVASCDRLLDQKGEGFADLVIASAVHSAGQAALDGVTRAYSMLKSSGALLLRGPVSPPENDPGVPVDELKAAALGSGFRPGRMRSTDVITAGPKGSQHNSRAIVFFK